MHSANTDTPLTIAMFNVQTTSQSTAQTILAAQPQVAHTAAVRTAVEHIVVYAEVVEEAGTHMMPAFDHIQIEQHTVTVEVVLHIVVVGVADIAAAVAVREPGSVVG